VQRLAGRHSGGQSAGRNQERIDHNTLGEAPIFGHDSRRINTFGTARMLWYRADCFAFFAAAASTDNAHWPARRSLRAGSVRAGAGRERGIRCVIRVEGPVCVRTERETAIWGVAAGGVASSDSRALDLLAWDQNPRRRIRRRSREDGVLLTCAIRATTRDGRGDSRNREWPRRD